MLRSRGARFALGVTTGSRSADGSVSIQAVRCLGYCFAGPAALDGDQACAGADLAAQLRGASAPTAPPIPVHNDSPVPVLTAGLVGTVQPWSVWPGVATSGTPQDILGRVESARYFDRRFQRVREALAPPAGARTDFAVLADVAARMGADLGCAAPADAMAECAAVAPLFGGIPHPRLDRDAPLHWPCVSAGFHFPGATVNSLTSSLADEVTGCPEYKLTAVRLVLHA